VCGIYGMVAATMPRGKSARRGMLRSIEQLALLNESRGEDATGMAVAHADRWHLVKGAVPARAFLRSRGYADMRSILSGAWAILGHTRMATMGSPDDPRNNHPIHRGSCIITHNGMISSPDISARALGLRRVAEVDSEIIARLADSRVSWPDFLRDYHTLRGSAACALLDLRRYRYVRLWRTGNPLTVAYVPQWHATVWSSEEIHLEVVLHGTGYRRIALPDDTGITVYRDTPGTIDRWSIRLADPLPYRIPRGIVFDDYEIEERDERAFLWAGKRKWEWRGRS